MSTSRLIDDLGPTPPKFHLIHKSLTPDVLLAGFASLFPFKGVANKSAFKGLSVGKNSRPKEVVQGTSSRHDRENRVFQANSGRRGGRSLLRSDINDENFSLRPFPLSPSHWAFALI
jgi:hypothetical protein